MLGIWIADRRNCVQRSTGYLSHQPPGKQNAERTKTEAATNSSVVLEGNGTVDHSAPNEATPL